jgi:hypothetical protein
MPSMTNIALAVAIVLGSAVAASAATKHPRAAQGQPAASNAGSGIITDRCLPTDSPCRTQPDGW